MEFDDEVCPLCDEPLTGDVVHPALDDGKAVHVECLERAVQQQEGEVTDE